LDELYWFIGRKGNGKTRENVYLMTMVSREPRQIVGFDVAFDKSPERIQRIVDSAPTSHKYCSDGYLGYIDVVYPGEHVRNVRNKNDTFSVESVNADLRHYMEVLTRRSRCFCRTIETLEAVVAVFVDAFNKFGTFKTKHRVPVIHKPTSTSKKSHKFRDSPLALVDFL
jgi:IS1 family transposase